MTNALAPSPVLEGRRSLFSLLRAAVGLDVPDEIAMHRPGKDPVAAAANDPDAMPVVDFAMPPDRVRWLGKATFGFTTPLDAEFLGLPGATMDAKWQTWLDQQLNPAAIADADCTARLAAGAFGAAMLIKNRSRRDALEA